MNIREKELMLHALGYNDKGNGCSHGKRYYIPYRNYYGAGGVHNTWEELCRKGLAETSNHSYYHVTNKGLAELSAELGVYIYSDSAYGLYKSKRTTLKAICENDAAIADHWFPISTKQISKETRLPITRVRESLKELCEEGLVKKDYVGGQDDDGKVFCIHGYVLTEKGEEDPYFREANEKEVQRVYQILENK